jgi:hypothetical protein
MPRVCDAAYWRFRAEEARAIAEEMGDPDARDTMYRLAENWEEIAQKVEVYEREPHKAH